MKASDLPCWKCGASLTDVLLPLSRLANCKACHSDLHVCRMCKFYDTSVASSCAEPVAEKVNDKQRKNFCGYLQPNPDIRREANNTASTQSKQQLDSLFGLDSEGSGVDSISGEELSEEEKSRQKLDDLFDTKEGK